MARNTTRLLFVSLLLLSVSAAHAGTPISTLSQGSSRPRLRAKPNVTVDDTVQRRLVLPVVGSLQGANGTFFKSAVTLMNFRGYGVGATFVPQRIKVEYYARDVSNVGAVPKFYTLNNLGEYWEDFIAEFFIPAKSGLGALVITAVDANGNDDPNGSLDASMRIYTAQASSSGCVTPGGSVSQALAAFPMDDLEDSVATGYIQGLRQDAKFRTNVGIVNHDSVKHNFTVHILKFNGQPEIFYTTDVEGKSMRQAGIPAGDYGPSMVVEIYTEDSGKFFWSAYGTSVDNSTGDGWLYKASW